MVREEWGRGSGGRVDTPAAGLADTFQRRSPALEESGFFLFENFRAGTSMHAMDYSPGVLEMAPPASLELVSVKLMPAGGKPLGSSGAAKLGLNSGVST